MKLQQRAGGRRLRLHRPPPGRLARRRRRSASPCPRAAASAPSISSCCRRSTWSRPTSWRPACSSACARARTRSTTWSASCTAGAGGATSAARTTTARISRACTSSCRRPSSPPAARAACAALLHISALGASPDRAFRVPALEGHRRAGGARRRRPRGHGVPPLGGVRARGHFLNRFAAFDALSAGRRPCRAREAKFQPVYVGDVARALHFALEEPDGARQGLRPLRAARLHDEGAGRVRLRDHRPAPPGHRPARAALVSAGMDARAPAGQAHDARQPAARCRCRTPAARRFRSTSSRRPSRPWRRPISRPPARASATRSFAGARAASARWRSTRCSAGPVRVVNVGLESFARDLAANGAAGGAGRLVAAETSVRREDRAGERARRCAASWLPSRCSPTCAARAS